MTEGNWGPLRHEGSCSTVTSTPSITTLMGEAESAYHSAYHAHVYQVPYFRAGVHCSHIQFFKISVLMLTVRVRNNGAKFIEYATNVLFVTGSYVNLMQALDSGASSLQPKMLHKC